MTEETAEKRKISVDGAHMTSPLLLQNQFLIGFGLPPSQIWNPDGLYDDLTMNVEAADVRWMNVEIARARAGDAAVDLVLECFNERFADQVKYHWPPEDCMTLVFE